ncbi:MAG TPA: hypothetical protein ENK57_22850 [Polyangiaceae bacterium]|nr:hypothetical protein [Polyangiaceae bacterium]
MSEEESSVLFSLKELMTIEEDRIKTEEEDRQKAQEEAERARLEAERQAREAEEARIRAEEERRRLEEQRRREEQARLEALKQAEIEKARAEAEQRARLEAMSAQQQHERQLARLNQDKDKKRLRNMLIGGAIAALLVLGLGGYFAYESIQEERRAKELQAAETKRKAEELAKQKREFEAQQAKIVELQEKLANAADPAQIEKLRKELEEATSKRDAIKSGGYRPGAGAGAGKKSAPAPQPKCAPGDPLCSDI